MLLLDIIKQLQEEGFEIKYRKRTDGGYIITKINGVSYSGASGNKIAREIAGAPLSKAKISQRAFNVSKYIKGKKKPKLQIPDDLVNELKRVQRLMRKTKAKGHVTKRKLRAQYLEGGRKQAKKYLSQMSRYAQGLAYIENIKTLCDRIKLTASHIKQDKYKGVKKFLYEIRDEIWNNRETFREAWVNPMYAYLYDIENGIKMNDSELINNAIAHMQDIIS